MDPVPLSPALAKLVQAQSGADLASELSTLLRAGRRRVTLGLGPGVDVPLLDEELHAAEVAAIDRELVVAAIRAETDGYVIERGESNFGVYVWCEAQPLWRSVPYSAEIRGLRPGDEVALGSTPAEAVKLRLPESPLVPPPRAHRSERRDRFVEQQRAREAEARPTPPTAPGRARAPTPTPAPARGPTPLVAPRRPRALYPADRYQRRFDAALLHWQYAVITFGGDERAVVHVDDPSFADLRAAITRNLDQPDRGYELFVKDPSPDLWIELAGESPRTLRKGEVVKLRGAGNRLGFGTYVVFLPAPAVPTARFGPRHEPTSAEIAEVLGMGEIELRDADRVRERYHDLARRLHPDRHDGDPGHTSRFLEIQAAFDAWKRRRPAG